MKLAELLTNVEYSVINGNIHTAEIEAITIDSRKVGDNSLFVCIEGLKVDGHRFVEQAGLQGASAVICQKEPDVIPGSLTVVKVDNSRKALALIALNFYNNPSESFNLIGVTGTNGKTSSTYFMESILNEWGRRTGVIGTVEIRLNGQKLPLNLQTSTTPDTIELQEILSKMRQEGITDVVMEVSSHALELDKVYGCKFAASIFTNLTQDHLDFHETMEDYCKAKAKLFKMSRYGIVNIDDKYGDYILKNGTCEFLTFSIDRQSDLKAENIEYLMDRVRFDVLIKGKAYPFELNVPGRFSVYNALGVIGASLCLNIPVPVIQKGINNIKGVPGRIQNIKNDKGFNVIVDYAHTPDGLINIINSVREFTKGKVITVFGCGGDRDKTKRPIMGEISGRLSDYTILTSDNPRSEQPEKIIDGIEEGIKTLTSEYKRCTDRKDAIYEAVKLACAGDSVIIAGKGHENYEIFADRTIHFDDLEVAREALNAL